MEKVPFKTINQIDEMQFSDFVSRHYGRQYCLQQQDGCMDRQTIEIAVPSELERQEEAKDPHSPVVTLEEWLSKDPSKSPINPMVEENWEVNLDWERDFYPELQEVLNDLHAKGLLDAGEYSLKIDW